ncbi:hypothetical protein FGO68_gene5260 [Halteria grandinella]|uniref:Uncharacterized protein n=1 Tax=Halteria grandinella TaxID=5974 RepID=A0A8J8NFM1_HALGN|nr:hypothetical protein FGO68_gene5260 [Halteria grandinella]
MQNFLNRLEQITGPRYIAIIRLKKQNTNLQLADLLQSEEVAPILVLKRLASSILQQRDYQLIEKFPLIYEHNITAKGKIQESRIRLKQELKVHTRSLLNLKRLMITRVNKGNNQEERKNLDSNTLQSQDHLQ